jgi:Na+/H+ antiporter NhaC
MGVAADILLCLYILLMFLTWCIIPGFFIWGVAMAISSFSPERQAQKATPVHLLKADAKRILTVLSIVVTILAAVLIVLIYGMLDLSNWLVRQWRKAF